MAMLGPWKYQKGRNFRHPGEREGYGTESNQVKSRRELYFHAETKEKGEISEGGKKNIRENLGRYAGGGEFKVRF